MIQAFCLSDRELQPAWALQIKVSRLRSKLGWPEGLAQLRHGLTAEKGNKALLDCNFPAETKKPFAVSERWVSWQDLSREKR